MEEENFSNSRKTYTVKQKLEIVADIAGKRKEGWSLNKCCEAWGIQTGQFKRWERNELKLLSAKPNNRCVGVGRKSILEDEGIEFALLEYMFELREQGLALTYDMIAFKAKSLSRAFREKSEKAQYEAARRFAIKHKYAIRVKTRESQRRHEDEEPCQSVGQYHSTRDLHRNDHG